MRGLLEEFINFLTSAEYDEEDYGEEEEETKAEEPAEPTETED